MLRTTEEKSCLQIKHNFISVLKFISSHLMNGSQNRGVLQGRTQVGNVGAQVERKFWTLNSSNILVRTKLPTNTLDVS